MNEAPGESRPARVVVFAPAPLLTVTIERRGQGVDVHLHAGGQGFWLARMVAALDVQVSLCASFGGESGAVVRALVERENVAVRAIDMDEPNIAYVHDRRGGDRVVVAETEGVPLSRHELDALYGTTLAAGLDARVCVLGGAAQPNMVPPDVYERLTRDMRANGIIAVADLQGAWLDAVVAGGIDVLKVSDEQLLADGRATSTAVPDLVDAMSTLHDAGAGTIVVSRAAEPVLALTDEGVWELTSPQVQPVDAHGAGDSLTAGIAAGLARAVPLHEALRLGVAAGRLNVARHGLGTGRRDDIEAFVQHVEMRVPTLAFAWTEHNET